MPTGYPTGLHINDEEVIFDTCEFDKPATDERLTRAIQWTDDNDMKEVCRYLRIAGDDSFSFLSRPAALEVEFERDEHRELVREGDFSFQIEFGEDVVMRGSEGLNLIAEQADSCILFFDNGYDSSLDDTEIR